MGWSARGIIAGAIGGAGKAIVDLAEVKIKADELAKADERRFEQNKVMADYQAEIAMEKADRLDQLRAKRAKTEREDFGSASASAWAKVVGENPKLDMDSSKAQRLYAQALESQGRSAEAVEARKDATRLKGDETRNRLTEMSIGAQQAASREAREARLAQVNAGIEFKRSESEAKREKDLREHFYNSGIVHTLDQTNSRTVKDDTIGGMAYIDFRQITRGISDPAIKGRAFDNVNAIVNAARAEYNQSIGTEKPLTPSQAYTKVYEKTKSDLKKAEADLLAQSGQSGVESIGAAPPPEPTPTPAPQPQPKAPEKNKGGYIPMDEIETPKIDLGEVTSDFIGGKSRNFTGGSSAYPPSGFVPRGGR